MRFRNQNNRTKEIVQIVSVIYCDFFLVEIASFTVVVILIYKLHHLRNCIRLEF